MNKYFVTIVFVFFLSTRYSSASLPFKTLEDQTKNIKIQVNQKLELFHIMALFSGANYLNSFDFNYKSKVKSYFEPFRNHSFVQFVGKVLANYHAHLSINGLFVRSDFTKDTSFVNFLSVKDFGLEETFSNKVLVLDSLSKVVGLFAGISKFEEFASQQTQYYNQKISEVKEAISNIDLKKHFEAFWGMQKDNYQIVICMLEQDIHSYWYLNTNGSNSVFFLSPKFVVDNDAKFGNANQSNLQEGKMSSVDYLYYGAGHEIGHSFINPIAIFYHDEIEKINFKIQTGDAKDIFLCESILRSLTAYFLIENNRASDAQLVLQMEKQQGYIYNELILEAIKEYCSNRAKFKNFNDYMPMLLTKLKEKANTNH